MSSDAIRLSSPLPGAAAQPWQTARQSGRRIQSSSSMVTDAGARASETELIREAQKGSRLAFDALVRQYDQAVLRLAMHLLGSQQDAEDVHQEAFLKAYRYLGNFRFECSFYTWIYRIVTNLCLDQLRRRKSRREDPATALDSSGEELDLLGNVSDDRSMANPARELERKILGEKIKVALDTLTPRERTVFELKHYQGLKLRTIGEMLNTTEETAKNTLFRATRKLRANLSEVRSGSAAPAIKATASRSGSAGRSGIPAKPAGEKRFESRDESGNESNSESSHELSNEPNHKSNNESMESL